VYEIPAVLLDYIEGLKRHDVGRIASAVADDLAFVTPARTLDRAQFLAMLQALYAGFPDWAYDHDPPECRADGIVVKWRQGGTHTGTLALPGLPEVRPTGRRVQIPKQDFFYRVRGGKIAEIRPGPVPGGAPWGVLEQLGVLAADASARGDAAAMPASQANSGALSSEAGVMRAIVCHAHGIPEVLRYEELPVPEPGPGEVLIRSEAVGVNYVDVMRRSGRHPTAPRPPFTPGIELCGRVVRSGPGVAEFRPGDRVLARCVTHGAYAEYVCAEARFAVPCPEQLPAEEGAALLVNALTAYHALVTRGEVREGESVLVTAAAGGVGTCAVQLARLLGARVVAAAGSAEKLDVARRLGADALVDYSCGGWPEEVLTATVGRGADLILESVGGEVFEGCLRCWAPRGRMVIYGKASGRPGVVTGDELHFGHRSACGLALGTVIEDTDLFRASMRRLLDWQQAGRLRVVVGHRFPLSQAAEAHRLLEGRRSVGKIVIVPEGQGQQSP
jgi:NADPH2:quinone reductase